MKRSELLPSLATLIALAHAPLPAQSLGSAFTYQGQLKDSGQPATGLYDFQFCLFDSPTNPIPLACAADFNDVPVEGGLFTVTLDFGAGPFVGQQRHLELRVRPGAATGGYTILAPRQIVRPAPEALRANVSSAAPWSGLTGVPEGFSDGVDNNSGGTVTSITAGVGLSGGTITGSGTVAVADGGIGAQQVNPAQVQARVTGSCAAGLHVRTINQDGSVVCEQDGNSGGTVTSIATGTGLSGGPISMTGTIAIADGGVGLAQINTQQVQARVSGNCTVGSYVRSVNADGTVICESDANSGGTVTTITTGAGLTGGPITGSGQIAIANGGVGLQQINVNQVQARVTGSCPLGQYMTTIAANGAITCVDFPPLAAVPARLPSGGTLWTSIAVAPDGNPIIGHDFGSQAFGVTKCSNRSCSGTSIVNVVVRGPPDIYEGSMAIGADGFPVFSFVTQDTLRVAKCIDPLCAAAAVVTVVDDPVNRVGGQSSIAIGTDGFPIISYQDLDAYALKVAKCTDPACASPATITVVDDPPGLQLGGPTSIRVPVDGIPIIAYFVRSTVSTLRFVRCSNSTCTGSPTIQSLHTLTTGNTVGGQLAIGTDGLPVVAFADYPEVTLKVSKCSSPDCSGAITTSTLGQGGLSAAIAVPADGLPVISHGTSALPQSWRVSKCANAACTSLSSDVVLSYQSQARNGSIAIGADGFPITSSEGVNFVKCNTPTCQ